MLLGTHIPQQRLSTRTFVRRVWIPSSAEARERAPETQHIPALLTSIWMTWSNLLALPSSSKRRSEPLRGSRGQIQVSPLEPAVAAEFTAFVLYTFISILACLLKTLLMRPKSLSLLLLIGHVRHLGALYSQRALLCSSGQ